MNEVLDRYSDADLDDEQDFEAMTAAQRRAAEATMERRDRRERRGGQGGRAARRTRYPGFLESDDMEDEDAAGGLLSQMKRRTRRQYDERKDLDDMDGVEDVRLSPVHYILRSCLLPPLGNTPRTVERHQGQVHRGVDRQ